MTLIIKTDEEKAELLTFPIVIGSDCFIAAEDFNGSTEMSSGKYVFTLHICVENYANDEQQFAGTQLVAVPVPFGPNVVQCQFKIQVHDCPSPSASCGEHLQSHSEHATNSGWNAYSRRLVMIALFSLELAGTIDSAHIKDIFGASEA